MKLVLPGIPLLVKSYLQYLLAKTNGQMLIYQTKFYKDMACLKMKELLTSKIIMGKRDQMKLTEKYLALVV